MGTKSKATKLPRLTDDMIQAACDAHYGSGHNINGLDLTSDGVNWSFRDGFRRMWSGIRKHLGSEDNGWSPIETAPRDGTQLDLWVVSPHGGYRATDFYFEKGRWTRKEGYPAIWRVLTVEPTHWRYPPGAPIDATAPPGAP